MNEENEIQNAEVEEINSPAGEEEKPEEKAKRAKRDFYVEIALFLIFGILAGFAIKTEATKIITMGFNDYKLKADKQNYNINELQAELIKEKTDATEEKSNN